MREGIRDYSGGQSGREERRIGRNNRALDIGRRTAGIWVLKEDAFALDGRVVADLEPAKLGSESSADGWTEGDSPRGAQPVYASLSDLATVCKEEFGQLSTSTGTGERTVPLQGVQADEISLAGVAPVPPHTEVQELVPFAVV